MRVFVGLVALIAVTALWVVNWLEPAEQSIILIRSNKAQLMHSSAFGEVGDIPVQKGVYLVSEPMKLIGHLRGVANAAHFPCFTRIKDKATFNVPTTQNSLHTAFGVPQFNVDDHALNVGVNCADVGQSPANRKWVSFMWADSERDRAHDDCRAICGKESLSGDLFLLDGDVQAFSGKGGLCLHDAGLAIRDNRLPVGNLKLESGDDQQKDANEGAYSGRDALHPIGNLWLVTFGSLFILFAAPPVALIGGLTGGTGRWWLDNGWCGVILALMGLLGLVLAARADLVGGWWM